MSTREIVLDVLRGAHPAKLTLPDLRTRTNLSASHLSPVLVDLFKEGKINRHGGRRTYAYSLALPGPRSVFDLAFYLAT